MITKVNTTNKDEYSVFFGKLTEALGTVEINSLAEYFNNLETIKGLTNAAPYLILPLDEPFFEINANTRNILVPDEFKRNGIGVTGDSMAESLFFSIDRYFDIQDLSQDNIRIYIQWETPAPNSVKGYSTPWLEDIDTNPGKLIFAWAIPSMLTKVAGNLKFSVRFQQVDNSGQIVYDFSTLPQTVRINAGLNFDLTKVKVDETSISTITNRLKNSSIGGVFIPQPVFYICTPSSITANEVITTDNTPTELKVSAYPAAEVPENYTVTYAFSREGNGVLSTVVFTDGNHTISNTNSNIVVGSADYEKTSDTTINPEKIYYSSSHEVLSGNNINLAEAYEFIVTFAVKMAGTYRVAVTASYSGRDAISGSSINVTSKDAYYSWTFDDPTEFVFGDKVSPTMATFNPSETGVVNFESGSEVGLTVKAPIDTNDVTNQQNGAEYQIILKRKDGANGAPEVVETSSILTPGVNDDANNSCEFDVDEMGYYFVTMTKHLNNSAVVESADSGEILITEALTQPVVTVVNVNTIVPINTQLLCESVEIENKNYPVGYSYQWYKSKNTTAVPPTDSPVKNNAINTAGWTVVAGATNMAYAPSIPGYYSLVAIATRNGSTQYGASDFFTVYDLSI